MSRQGSKFIRISKRKDGSFIPTLIKIDESEAYTGNTSLKHLFINNYKTAAN